MSLMIRDGELDVAIVQGPRVTVWPSVGVRAISQICSQNGLKVGDLGGKDLSVIGIIPELTTGALLIAEDQQKRIHRIRSKALVKISEPLHLPEPFEGWLSPSLIPISTAEKLLKRFDFSLTPAVAILGVSNQAVRFGAMLLEKEYVKEVICIHPSEEDISQYRAWEVEMIRFESLGGKVIAASPISLKQKAPLLWSLRVKDEVGIRVIDVSYVISAGPFLKEEGLKEYPPGSFLYEFYQTAKEKPEEDIEGWVLEELRGRRLGARLSKILASDDTVSFISKDRIERSYNRSKRALARMSELQKDRFEFRYDGKWLHKDDRKKMLEFAGVPQRMHLLKPVATLECFDDIPCDLCQRACPEDAIDIQRTRKNGKLEIPQFLIESKCTGCMKCVTACPSSAANLIHEKEDGGNSVLTLKWLGKKVWKKGEVAQLLNRKSEILGTGRVISSQEGLVSVEMANHLTWEARAIRPIPSLIEDEAPVYIEDHFVETQRKIEINLDGEKRRVTDQLTLTEVLFENARARFGDKLNCTDGSCKLCELRVDGVKKLACQTVVRQGMVVVTTKDIKEYEQDQEILCPCLKIKESTIKERIKGGLGSPEAVISATRVGQGKCHSQNCHSGLKQILNQEGVDAKDWIDWRFPFSEWNIGGRD